MLQGTRSYVLQDADGNVELTHSISAGLDYASVGPEHAWLREIGRAEYTWIDDAAALAAFQRLGREEGHPAGARIVARDRARLPAGAGAAEGRHPAGEPVGPRRQGRAQRPGGAGGSTLMARIADAFARIRDSKQPGLVAYVTAGDPDLARTAEILVALARNGADVLEVGMPFSDPLADGPVIQRASERALASGSTLRGALRDDPRRRGRGSTRRSCSSPTPIPSCAWARRRS